MAKQFPQLDSKHITFIQQQKLFFVATAASEGLVNLSPKGMDSLRVLDEKTVVWLNLTGSGNESAAHLRQNPRMTMMFCSFDKQPLILRLYGNANVLHKKDNDWQTYSALFPEYRAARQIFVLPIDIVQTSCGFGVPFFTYQGERDTLAKWADNKSDAEIQQYWQKKNLTSLDGHDAGLQAHLDDNI